MIKRVFKIVLSLALCGFVFVIPNPVAALILRSIRVTVPAQSTLQTNSGTVVALPHKENEFKIYFTFFSHFPVTLTVTDIFGAHVTESFADPSQLQNLVIGDGIVRVRLANPPTLTILPELCPRAELITTGGKKSLLYHAARDILNQRPTIQLVDPDVRYVPAQQHSLDHFDNKNVLTVQHVKIKYDYEDTNILDYEGPHPMTGKNEKIYEGEGGFYANLHYAVVPFEERILHLSRQELLNLAEGRLGYIDRQDLRPKLRLHAFLPGPYLSKKSIYEMCEWGDSTYQSKVQEMAYADLAIWDWDIPIDGKPVTKLILIVWEGDEEDWLIDDGLIDPYYLTDDVVGVFTIQKSNTADPLRLKNAQGNFEAEVRTVE